MMDYAMPKADMLPFYETDRTVTPTPVNPLGIKGAGETGTIAADAGRRQRRRGRAGPARASTTSKRCRLSAERVWKIIQARQERQVSRGGRPCIPAVRVPRPGSVQEALGLLGQDKDDAKILAGGHSLIPMMKLRLAQPKHLIDLRRSAGLAGIKEDGGTIVIGAMTTHWAVESLAVVKAKCPCWPRRRADRRSGRCAT